MLKLKSIKKIRFILTDFCNYQCKFCHNEGFQTKNSVYLDLKSILTLTKIAKKMCIKKITLTGGEPLLHKKILDIVKGIKKIYPGVLLGMSTNGMGFNESNFLNIIG
ncbi:MAG: radical SAM protein [bacterium]